MPVYSEEVSWDTLLGHLFLGSADSSRTRTWAPQVTQTRSGRPTFEPQLSHPAWGTYVLFSPRLSSPPTHHLYLLTAAPGCHGSAISQPLTLVPREACWVTDEPPLEQQLLGTDPSQPSLGGHTCT